MAPTLVNSEAEILARVVNSQGPSFTSDFAQTLLTLCFHENDRQRMHNLSQKAQKGELSEEEQNEIDNYERVGNLLSILQSKARLLLRKSSPNDQVTDE